MSKTALVTHADTATTESSQTARRSTATVAETTPAAVATTSAPGSFWGYVRSLGPGAVIALTWVGTGDMIGNAVAGGNYGYALLWALVLSVAIRFLFVNMLARYPLYNTHRDTSIVRGYSRLSPLFTGAMLVSFVAYGHILGAYTFSGAGEALANLTGGAIGKLPWALLAAASVLVVTLRGSYTVLENLFKAILAVMMVAFLVGVVRVGVSWGELGSGLAFATPAQEGTFDSGLIVAGLLLATTGSILNFVYPQFLVERGWTTPGHRKIQQYDLLFGALAVLFLAAAIWIVGAEVLAGEGSVDTAEDIAGGLAGAVASIGSDIFFLGLLAAAWTSIAGAAFALSKMAVECLQIMQPGRTERYGGDTSRDPAHTWVVLFAVAAVVWSAPFAPDFVVLTVALSALSAPFLVLIAGGLVLLLNRRDLMGEHVNRWWNNVTLALIIAIVTYAGYEGIKGIVEIIS